MQGEQVGEMLTHTCMLTAALIYMHGVCVHTTLIAQWQSEILQYRF